MGKYDRAMKLVVAENPQAIAEFVLRYACVDIRADDITVVATLDTEFEGYDLDADGLLKLLTGGGEEILLHIEFQSVRDRTMPDRQIEYALRSRKKYGDFPIISCVIYLRPDGVVPEPPMRWQLRNGHKILVFDYTCIKLWELTREDLLDLNQPALLPLVLLTKSGANRTIVSEMFDELLSNKLQSLLPAGELLAALALKGDDLAWLERMYLRMTDVLRDSPAYRWMTEDARREGLEQGREESRRQIQETRQQMQETHQQMQENCQRALGGYRQIIVSLIDELFPKLSRLARKQVCVVEDLDRLQSVILRISLAKDVADVEETLLDLDDNK